MRRELPRDGGLEHAHPLVRVVEALFTEHRPQRLALVHRDHRVRAVLSGDHAIRISASSWSWTIDTGHSASYESYESSRSIALRLSSPWTTRRNARASMIVRRPTLTPCLGTSSSDLNSGNVRRLSFRVDSASRTTAVRPSRGAPGPSIATWPSLAPEAS